MCYCYSDFQIGIPSYFNKSVFKDVFLSSILKRQFFIHIFKNYYLLTEFKKRRVIDTLNKNIFFITSYFNKSVFEKVLFIAQIQEFSICNIITKKNICLKPQRLYLNSQKIYSKFL